MKKNKIISMLFIVVMMCIIFTACGSKEESADNEETVTADGEIEIGTVKVGASFTYYPFGYIDGEEKAGYEVDIWNEISERCGFEVEYVQAAFSGLFGMLDKGEIDTIANQISINEERKEKYNFSDVYCYSPLKLVVYEGNPENIQSLDDCVGKKVSVGVEGNEIDIINELYPNGEIELLHVETGHLLQVSAGKASACLQSAPTSAVQIKDNELPLEIVGESIYDELDAYPFAKTERGDAIREKVNAAIEEMHADGTLTEISMKWFDYDISSVQ